MKPVGENLNGGQAPELAPVATPVVDPGAASIARRPRLARIIDNIGGARVIKPDDDRRTPAAPDLSDSAAAQWQPPVEQNTRISRWKRIGAVLAVAGVGCGAALGGVWWERGRTRPAVVGEPDAAPNTPAPEASIPPGAATAEQPWQNGLGMKFVPVAATGVLFSVWETRRRDFEGFLDADHSAVNQWRREKNSVMKRQDEIILTFDGNGNPAQRGTWDSPGYAVTPDHPATGVSVTDAMMFCDWLTLREQAGGRLLRGQFYRLPTEEEWFKACGGKASPVRKANLAGPEADDAAWPARKATFAERDAFPRTAPAGSFPPEPFGICDMSGNVSEWVLAEPLAQILGPDWSDGAAVTASFGYPRLALRHLRLGTIGFRIVLEFEHRQP